MRILAEIAADIGHAQLSLRIKEALVASAEHEAQQALALARQKLDLGSGSATLQESSALHAAKACVKASNVAFAAGIYSKVERYTKMQHALFSKVLGPENPDTLESRLFLGMSLGFQGKHDAAEGIQSEVRRGVWGKPLASGLAQIEWLFDFPGACTAYSQWGARTLRQSPQGILCPLASVELPFIPTHKLS